MEQAIAGSEARAEAQFGERLERLEQAKESNAQANGEALKALAARFDEEAERNDKALSEFRASIETMEQAITGSAAQAEAQFGERLNRLEQAKESNAQASDEALKALAAKFDEEIARNEKSLSEFRASMETMEGNLAELELLIVDAKNGGLSLHDQAKKKEAEALREIVEDLMEQGSIRQAIEMHWNKKKA